MTMETYVILLRGVMPRGKNKVLMGPLREVLSEAGLVDVRTYIQSQEEHHQHVSFQDELRELFKRHGIEFDERYVWD